MRVVCVNNSFINFLGKNTKLDITIGSVYYVKETMNMGNNIGYNICDDSGVFSFYDESFFIKESIYITINRGLTIDKILS